MKKDRRTGQRRKSTRRETTTRRRSTNLDPEEGRTIVCSFCRSDSRSSKHMILLGPGDIAICDSCIDKCSEILANLRAATG
jgi:hypothetical protein